MRCRMTAWLVAAMLCLLPGCHERPIAARQVVSSMGIDCSSFPLTAVLELIREEDHETITVQGNNIAELFSAAEQRGGEPLYLGTLQSIVFSGVPDGGTLREYLRMLLADGRIAPNAQIALCDDAIALFETEEAGDTITALLTQQYTNSRCNGLKELINLLETEGRDGLLVWLSAESGKLQEAGVVPTGSRDYTAFWQPEDVIRLLLGKISEMRFTLPVEEGEAAVQLRRMAISGVSFRGEETEPTVTLLVDAAVQSSAGRLSRKQLETALRQELQQRLAEFNREMTRYHSDFLGLHTRLLLSGYPPAEFSLSGIHYDLYLVLRDPRGLLQ